MRRFKFGFILCVSALAFGCDGPQSGEEGDASDGSRLRVGFSQIGAESSWRTAETESIRSEAEKRDVELLFADAQSKQENQVQAVRDFIQQKVDAIVLAPMVETGWDVVLNEAKRAKIPVVLVDRGVTVDDDSLYTTLIASDFVAQGRAAATWLAEKTGGQARIVELQGTPGAAPALDRKRGFDEVIAGHPKMKIVRSQTGDFNLAKGKEVMESFLQSVGDEFDAVYAHNDDMALGAIQALEAAGKSPGEDVLVVSIDGVKGAFEALVAGQLNCSVECSPLLGSYAFDAVEKILAGETLDKWTVVTDAVFEQEQAIALIDSRLY